MPGRAKGKGRVSKLYKLSKQGRLQEQPKEEEKKEKKKEKKVKVKEE